MRYARLGSVGMPERGVHDELHDPDSGQSPRRDHERLCSRCNRINHDCEFDPPSVGWVAGPAIAFAALFVVVWYRVTRPLWKPPIVSEAINRVRSWRSFSSSPTHGHPPLKQRRPGCCRGKHSTNTAKTPGFIGVSVKTRRARPRFHPRGTAAHGRGRCHPGACGPGASRHNRTPALATHAPKPNESPWLKRSSSAHA